MNLLSINAIYYISTTLITTIMFFFHNKSHAWKIKLQEIVEIDSLR